MSYRTFKKLMGETSLERKCRFLFGGVLMLLITVIFYFYAQSNLRVLEERNRQRAELLISQNLQMVHFLSQIKDSDELKTLSRDLKPDDLREDNWKFIPEDDKDPTRRPT